MSDLMDVCHEEVSRKGMSEPCDRPAIAMADDPEGAYPVCQRHIHGRAVPLAEYRPQIVAEVTRQVQVRLLRDLAAELRRERCVGGIEYVDATWLEARAAAIEREAREAPVTDLTPAAQVDAWNTAHPVGSPVQYWPGMRDGEPSYGVTTHPASVLGGHTPVAWIDTCGSCVALTHVRVLEARADQISRGGGERG